LSDDDRYAASVSWAFLSWRPTNDWLVRAGKLRIPTFLYSETTDVGATFEFARLPVEMYSLSPTYDFTGLAFSRSWALGNGDLSLDGYWGNAHTHFRLFLRDDIPPVQERGALFVPAKVEAYGLALTLRRGIDVYRVGVHEGRARADGIPLVGSYPFVALGPGIGYYQTSNLLPGPGVVYPDSISSTILTLGADVHLPAQFRIIGELSRRDSHRSVAAPEGTGGYFSVLRRMGAWTPYVTYAQLKSSSQSRGAYNAVNGNRVPAVVPGADQINAAQRAGADGIAAYDQKSFALGVSYALTPRSRLKGEIQRVRIGEMSSLIDAPSGGRPGDGRSTSCPFPTASSSRGR
jgi:hypothetical protein